MAGRLDKDKIPEAKGPRAQSTVSCDDCEGIEDVFSYCINCPGALCEKCKESHKKRKMTQSHRIVDYDDPIVENLKKVAALGKCQKHTDSSIVAYCEKCDIPCCAHCLAADHRNHEAKEIFEKYTELKIKTGKFIKIHANTLRAISDDIADTKEEIQRESSSDTKTQKEIDAVLKEVRARSCRQ